MTIVSSFIVDSLQAANIPPCPLEAPYLRELCLWTLSEYIDVLQNAPRRARRRWTRFRPKWLGEPTHVRRCATDSDHSSYMLYFSSRPSSYRPFRGLKSGLRVVILLNPQGKGYFHSTTLVLVTRRSLQRMDRLHLLHHDLLFICVL